MTDRRLGLGDNHRDRRRGGLAFALLAALALVLLAPAASAQKEPVSALITKGQDLFDEQRYEESIQTLSAALLRPNVSKEEKVAVYKLLAYNYIVLRQESEAEAAVCGLFEQDREYSLPETESPRFRDFFDDKREGCLENLPVEPEPGTPTSKVRIKHISPAQVDAGMDVRLEGSLDDPEAEVAKIRLFYRSSSADKFESTTVKYAMRKFTAEIPSDAVEPPLVEYYLEALDKDGLPVASRGDSEGPLRIAVPDDSSVLTSPWLWVPVSVAVVAAVVIPVVIVTTSTSESAVTVNVFER